MSSFWVIRNRVRRLGLDLLALGLRLGLDMRVLAGRLGLDLDLALRLGLDLDLDLRLGVDLGMRLSLDLGSWQSGPWQLAVRILAVGMDLGTRAAEGWQYVELIIEYLSKH